MKSLPDTVKLSLDLINVMRGMCDTVILCDFLLSSLIPLVDWLKGIQPV